MEADGEDVFALNPDNLAVAAGRVLFARLCSARVDRTQMTTPQRQLDG